MAIAKPGRKTSYDFWVVLLDATHAVEEALTHADLLSECAQALAANAALGSAFLERAFSVVAGAEPPASYPAVGTRRTPDYLLKALKWILAQEDINYPIQRGMQGRRVLADRLAEVLDGVPLEHVLQRTRFAGGPRHHAG